MEPAPAGSLLAFLARIPDPRGRQGRRHSLEAMLASVVCALLQGARGYVSIAQWLHSQDVELWHALGYFRRPPKKGAFRKLLMALPAVHLEQALRDWIADCLGTPPLEELQPVAMDGKTLCGTLQAHERAVHLLSLLDHATGCTLSQIRVDSKTNESKAALELLRTLVWKGRLVTGDAIFCHREVCQEVLDQQGHYFFVVKDNQSTLKEAIAAEFQAAFSPDERTTSRVPSGTCRNPRQGAWSAGAASAANQYAFG